MADYFEKRGFTLIEILVVISILMVLASIVVRASDVAAGRARIAKAKLELNQLRNGIKALELDTAFHPNKLSLTPCKQDPEVYLDSCAAGLACTDGGFPNWSGPYITAPPLDPWGTYYRFDPDYRCRTFVEGCKSVADNTWVRAIVSFGPNKSGNYDDGDNIALILCVP